MKAYEVSILQWISVRWASFNTTGHIESWHLLTTVTCNTHFLLANLLHSHCFLMRNFASGPLRNALGHKNQTEANCLSFLPLCTFSVCIALLCTGISLANFECSGRDNVHLPSTRPGARRNMARNLHEHASRRLAHPSHPHSPFSSPSHMQGLESFGVTFPASMVDHPH